LPRAFPVKFLFAFAALLFSLCNEATSCDNPERLRFSFIPQGNVRNDADAFQFMIERVQKQAGKTVVVVNPTSYASVTP
jgi:phosphonate transport system substrate-binding protein